MKETKQKKKYNLTIGRLLQPLVYAVIVAISIYSDPNINHSNFFWGRSFDIINKAQEVW